MSTGSGSIHRQALAHGHQGWQVRRLHFLQDLRTVFFDGVRLDLQPLAQGFVAQPLQHQHQHLALARAEVLELVLKNLSCKAECFSAFSGCNCRTITQLHTSYVSLDWACDFK